MSSPTRPRRMIRSNGYLPQGWTLERWAAARESQPARSRGRRPRLDGHPCPRHARLPRWGLPGPRLRQQHPPGGEGRGRARRLRLPRLRPRLHPAAVLPRHRAVPLGGAVGRSRGHLQDRRQGEGNPARQPSPPPLARHGAGAHPLPGPAGAHLLGRAGRPPPPRPRLQRDGRLGRAEGPHRHRPRPPRFRLGRQPQPRNRRR